MGKAKVHFKAVDNVFLDACSSNPLGGKPSPDYHHCYPKTAVACRVPFSLIGTDIKIHLRQACIYVESFYLNIIQGYGYACKASHLPIYYVNKPLWTHNHYTYRSLLDIPFHNHKQNIGFVPLVPL